MCLGGLASHRYRPQYAKYSDTSNKEFAIDQGTFADVGSYKPCAIVLEGFQVGAIQHSEQRSEAIVPRSPDPIDAGFFSHRRS
jgi:hypothetical protein